PLDGDIVRQIPPLEGPDREEVGLELGDQIDGRLEAIPVVVALVLLGADPEVIGDDPAEASQEEKLHHEAAGVDLADRRLAEVPALLLLAEPIHVREHHPEQEHDDETVDDLLALIGNVHHAATSRFFKMKYPTMENGRA